MFDYVGVLVNNFTTKFFDFLHEKTQLSKEDIEISFRNHWGKLKLGNITDKEFWEYLTQELKLTPQQVEEAKEFALQICQPTPETIEHVKRLAKTYDLYLLSNSCYGWSEQSFNTNGLKPFFKKSFFSHNMGLAKPDPLIYKKSIQQTGLKPQEILFTDDKAENVQAAQEEGMQGIVFTNCDTFLEKISSNQ